MLTQCGVGEFDIDWVRCEAAGASAGGAAVDEMGAAVLGDVACGVPETDAVAERGVGAEVTVDADGLWAHLDVPAAHVVVHAVLVAAGGLVGTADMIPRHRLRDCHCW